LFLGSLILTPGRALRCGSEWHGASQDRLGMWTLEMDFLEGSNLHRAHGNGWEAKEVQPMPAKKSRSIGPTFYGRPRAGMVGRVVDNISVGPGGR
jgi:hypothetical protein